MDLVALKQREQTIVKALREAQDRATDSFRNINVALAEIDEMKNVIAEEKAYIAALTDDREVLVNEVQAVQSEMNRQMDEGPEQILADLKAGKVGLVDLATGQPKTLALFARR